MMKKLSSILILLILISCGTVSTKVTMEDIGKEYTFIALLLNNELYGNKFTSAIHIDMGGGFDIASYIGPLNPSDFGYTVTDFRKIPAKNREVELWYQDGRDRAKLNFSLEFLPDKLYCFYFKPDGEQKKLFLDIYELEKDYLEQVIAFKDMNDGDFYNSVYPIMKEGTKLKSDLLFTK